MVESDLAKRERTEWAGDVGINKKEEVNNYSFKYIGQLKSSIIGKKGESISWSLEEPCFILGSDIKIDDDVVIYERGEKTYWHQKDSFVKDFIGEIIFILESLKK